MPRSDRAHWEELVQPVRPRKPLLPKRSVTLRPVGASTLRPGRGPDLYPLRTGRGIVLRDEEE